MSFWKSLFGGGASESEAKATPGAVAWLSAEPSLPKKYASHLPSGDVRGA